MLIVMQRPQRGKTEEETRRTIEVTSARLCAVQEFLCREGFGSHCSEGAELVVVGLVGKVEPERAETLEARLRAIDGVKTVIRVSTPYKLVARSSFKPTTTIPINGVNVGGQQLLVIAGPCAAESMQQLEATAAAVKRLGAHALRAGAYKPRTSPYTFQGVEDLALPWFREIHARHQLPIVSEVVDGNHVRVMEHDVQVLQIGMRNMQNYPLLDTVARSRRPILLKRNQAATLDEFLLAAERIARFNPNIILCLRGTCPMQGQVGRFRADIDDIPVLHDLTHLPVIWDPSHPAGDRQRVIPLALAGIAAGADGLLVEVHPDPSQALSDANQQLTFEQFGVLMAAARRVAESVGRTV